MTYLARFVNGANVLDCSENQVISLYRDFIPPGINQAVNVSVGTSANRYGGGTKIGAKYNDRDWSFSLNIIASTEAYAQMLARRVSSFLAQDGTIYFEWEGTGLPRPLWGQLGYPVRYEIISAVVGIDQMYADNPRRASYRLPLTLRIKPLAVGNQQRLASALGAVWLDTIGSATGEARGLRIHPACTNKYHNPVYGNSTWNADWTAGANLITAQNTEAAHCFPGSTFSALVTSKASTLNTWTENLTLTAATYYLVSIVERPDGAAVTSSDCQLFYNASALTTTFRHLGNNVYLATASVTAEAVAHPTGLQIKIGRSLYVWGNYVGTANVFQVGMGDMLGWVWDTAATPYNSTSTATAGRVSIMVASDTFINNLWSIHLVWIPDEANTLTGNRFLFSLGAANIRCTYTAADDKINLLDNTNTASTGALTFSAGDMLEVLCSAGNSGLAVYVKNHTTGTTYSGTNATYTVPAAASYIYIGTDDSAANHAKGMFALFETYNDDLTSTQNTALQTALGGLLAAGGHIGDIPWLWTRAGNNVASNVLDSDQANYAVCAGIAGDVDADTVYEIYADPTGYDTALWIGKHTDYGMFRDPLTNWWMEGGTDAEVGNSNDDYLPLAFPIVTATVLDIEFVAPSTLSGPFHFFTCAKCDAATSNLTAQYYLADNEGVIESTAVEPMTTTYKLFYHGSLTLPNDRIAPQGIHQLYAGIYYTNTAAARIDYAMLINGKMIVIRPTTKQLPGSATVITPLWIMIHGGEASYDRGVSFICSVDGSTIDLSPGAYNTLQSIVGEDNTALVTTRSIQYSRVLITPRWSLI